MAATTATMGQEGSDQGSMWQEFSGTLGADTLNMYVKSKFRKILGVTLEYAAAGGTLPLCWTVSGSTITVTGGAAVAITGRVRGQN